MDKLWADRLLGSSVHLLIFSFTMSGIHIVNSRLVDFVLFSFETEVDAKQRLIVWLNGLEYHVYNRLEQNKFNKVWSDDKFSDIWIFAFASAKCHDMTKYLTVFCFHMLQFLISCSWLS